MTLIPAPSWVWVWRLILVKARFLALLSAAAILAACSGGGTGTAIPSGGQTVPQDNELTTLSTFSARDNATGTLVRILPTVDVISSLPSGDRTTSATSPLLYHNGPVQTAPQLYVVFWGSAWNGSGDPNGVDVPAQIVLRRDRREQVAQQRYAVHAKRRRTRR